MLIVDINNLVLGKRNNIVDEDGNLKYWTQPDFAYKHRVHFYRNDNSEVGYVQYKILSSQKEVEYYDWLDNKIDISNLKIINRKSNLNYDIENEDGVVSISYDGNKCYIKSNLNLDKHIMLFFGNLK